MKSHMEGLSQLNAEDVPLSGQPGLCVEGSDCVLYVGIVLSTFKERTTACHFMILNMKSLFLAKPWFENAPCVYQNREGSSVVRTNWSMWRGTALFKKLLAKETPHPTKYETGGL